MASGTIPVGNVVNAMSRGWYPNGVSIYNVQPGIYATAPNNIPSENVYGNQYGALLIAQARPDYPFIMYIGSLGQSAVWSHTGKTWHASST